MNYDKAKKRNKAPNRKKTAIIRKSAYHEEDNSNRTDRSMKQETDKRKPDLIETTDDKSTRSDTHSSVNELNEETHDDPPYIEDLFLKVKEDRKRAGIAKETITPNINGIGFQNLHLEQEEINEQKSEHRPASTPILNSAPSTPSSLNLSAWEDSSEDDIDTEGGEVEVFEEHWSNDKTLAECNMYMLNHSIKCDVTMLVGDQYDIIRAHSFILTNRSPEFAKLLGNNPADDIKPLILREIRLDVFQQIIRYIYTDEADITTELAWAIIPTTSLTGTRALRRKCFNHLLCEVTSDCVCTILEYTHTYKDTEVYDKCSRFIHVNAQDVFQTENFCDLCIKCVDDITKSDDLNADEFTVFEALTMWADKECERKELQPTDPNRREVLGMMIFNVRFAMLEVDEFSERISKRELLSPDETMEIFQIFHGKTDDLSEHLLLHPRRKYHVKYHLQKGPNMDNKDDGTEQPADSMRPLSSKSFRGKRSSNNKRSVTADADQPCRRVVRFQSFGDTWNMDGADCIAFKVSSPIVLRGVQIFGPDKEIDAYSVDIKLYDDVKNEIRADKVLIEPSPGNIINDVVLNEPTRIPADRFFTLQLIIRSKPTRGGGDGVKVVDSGGVIFEFRTADDGSPRTNASIGQIPSIVYSKIDQ